MHQTLETQVRERTAGLEWAVIELKQEVARRQQAESALKASEQRYESLYEHNPFMYFTLASDGIVLSVNHFGAEQLGYHKEDLVGQSIVQVFDMSDHRTVLEGLAACVANPYTLLEWDIQKIRKDGTRLWVKERARAVHDHTGMILVLVVCEDVTQRRYAEEQSRESEARWRALYEHAGVGIAQLTLDGQFLRVNPHLCKILGYSSEAMLERDIQDLTHPDDLQGNLASLAELLAGKHHSFSMEMRYRRIDHTWMWVDLTLSLVHTGSSDQAYLIAVIQNIDDRKRSHSLLQAAMNSVADGLLIVDRQGKVTSANQRFLSLWNIPDELADGHGRRRLASLCFGPTARSANLLGQGP
ncbi:MAG: PAS domain S-box protein [Nitrospira sp.]|nr:PAS domain S-box protein [Nitrospira sp.]